MADARAVEALSGRVVAVVNESSGGADAAAAADMAALFRGAGLGEVEILAASGKTLEATLAATTGRADVMVVLGGDGTIRSAADACGSAGRYLVPLPGGTMNMLPRALYGARSWRQALADTLAEPEVRPIAGGIAGETAFFVAALVGAPTLWADAREALRERRPFDAFACAVTAARRSLSEPLAIRFDGGRPGTAEAVVVVCPLISKVLDDRERSLEAAAIETASAAEALRLGFHALFDDWRSDPAVKRAKVRTVQVAGHGRVPMIVDGEKVRVGRTVVIRFVPLAFWALAPAETAAAST